MADMNAPINDMGIYRAWRARISRERIPDCRITEEQREETVRRYAAGGTLARIGESFGCAPRTVKRHIKLAAPGRKRGQGV